MEIEYIQCPFCGATITASAYRCDCCGHVISTYTRQQTPPETHIETDQVEPYRDAPYLYKQPQFKKTTPQSPRKEDHTTLWVIVSIAATFFVFGITFLILSYTNQPEPRQRSGSRPAIVDNRSPSDTQADKDQYVASSDVDKAKHKKSGAVWMMDLVNRDYLSEQISEYTLGSSFPSGYSTNHGVRMYGSGYINTHSVSVDVYLEPNGEIHGRYHNENGINLDANGYIDRNGNIRLMLGHKTEKSYWTLYHKEGFNYTGYWGQKDLPSALSFYIR